MTTHFQNPITLLVFYFNNIFGEQIDIFIALAALIVIIHSFTILTIARAFEAFITNSSFSRNFRLGIFPYTFTMLVIVMTHILDLLYFAYLIDGMGVFTDQLTSFYFAGEMYTTLGYGNFVLAPQWRGLPLIIGFTGLFSVSISGAGLFSMLQELARFRYQSKSHSKSQQEL